MEKKVVILGVQNVGKTTFTRLWQRTRGTGKELSSAPLEPTIGAAFVVIRYPSDLYGKTLQFNIFDTAGADRFVTLLPMYLRGAHIVIFMYDAYSLSPTGVTYALKRLDEVLTMFAPPSFTSSASGSGFPHIIILGNKADRSWGGENDPSPASQINGWLEQHSERIIGFTVTHIERFSCTAMIPGGQIQDFEKVLLEGLSMEKKDSEEASSRLINFIPTSKKIKKCC